MKVHYGLEKKTDIKKSVVTTGSFDGVHVGHQVIIKRINELAKMVGGESVLITFHPHPRKILYPDTLGKDLKLINTQREKISMLETTGLDHLVIMPFTKEFARTPSDIFIRDILAGKLNIKKSVVGFNHFFGFNKEGNYEQLEAMGMELGFEVEEIPHQDIQNETVSSTKIRKAISEGNIQRANAYLNHIYLMKGALNIYKSDDKLLSSIINHSYIIEAEEQEKLMPPEGIYAIRVKQKNKNIKALGMRQEALYGKNTLLVIPVESDLPGNNSDSVIHFYKQLSDKFSTVISSSILKSKIEEAKELIY